jgi:hypothetical protein
MRSFQLGKSSCSYICLQISFRRLRAQADNIFMYVRELIDLNLINEFQGQSRGLTQLQARLALSSEDVYICLNLLSDQLGPIKSPRHSRNLI